MWHHTRIHSCGGPGSAATLPQDQLRPYPCQGSAATLPTRILWKGQRFLPLSRVSCDPTWLQCKESYRFLHCFEVIQVQVQHSFYQIFPPPLATHALRPYLTTFLLSNFPPPLATHAFNDSSSSTTFLLSKFPPPLPTHALRPYLTTFLLSNFAPPWQPMLSMIQVQVQHSFYQIFPPPWQPMLCDPTWQHSFYQISPPLGNPRFQWFTFKCNIPFIKFFPPPLGNPCFATLPDNIPFLKSSPPPLATHAFNDSSSSTTFLL